jgi:hypothetical protein
MVQLSPADRAKLEGIVAAGGLTSPADVVRVPVAPSDPDVAAVWKRYLNRNFDSLVAMTQRICGPMDLVLFDGDVVTVCRHPHTRKRPEHIRAEVFAQLSEKLFGRPDAGGSWARAMGAQATALPPMDIQLPQEAEAPSPELEAAMRLISGQAPEPEVKPAPAPVEKPAASLEVSTQKVVRSSGPPAIWIKSATPTQKAGEPRRDYFRADADLAEFDIALLRQTETIAGQMIKAKAPAAQLMFPVNINVLRKPEHRQRLVAALKEVDPRNAVRMEAVLVRCETGVPQSVIAEAAGYLRKAFGLVWVFAGPSADPRTFLWSDLKMGLVVSGRDAPKATLDAWRAAADKAGWQLGILS